ncbi:MAG: hypothetical protein OXU27_02830, partial [Candidatus Poribacteria bacterium]|nr:hypothetical protein [Candidatus Poribacteria bacterium]
KCIFYISKLKHGVLKMKRMIKQNVLSSEAENWVFPRRSKIYDDARKNILTTEKDPGRGNKKVVDIAELERVYGNVRNPEESETEKDGQSIEPEKLIQSYENRIHDLEKHLTEASNREETLTTEKMRLLDLADRLQKQNEVLMITTTEKQKIGVFAFLREKFLS